MFCKNCGKELGAGARFCPECGTDQSAELTQYQGSRYNLDPNDSGSVGWAILGFFVPLVGLILYLMWAHTKPKCAKMAGLGALIYLVATVVFLVIYFIVVIALTGSFSFTSP